MISVTEELKLMLTCSERMQSAKQGFKRKDYPQTARYSTQQTTMYFKETNQTDQDKCKHTGWHS